MKRLHRIFVDKRMLAISVGLVLLLPDLAFIFIPLGLAILAVEIAHGRGKDNSQRRDKSRDRGQTPDAVSIPSPNCLPAYESPIPHSRP